MEILIFTFSVDVLQISTMHLVRVMWMTDMRMLMRSCGLWYIDKKVLRHNTKKPLEAYHHHDEAFPKTMFF